MDIEVEVEATGRASTASVREMLSQKASRTAMGKAAPKVIEENHSLLAAARRLNAILEEASRR